MEETRRFLESIDLADLDAIIDFVMERRPDSGPVWVYGYGSLVWNPEMTFDQSQPADLPGYRREMCISSTVHRGTPEHPGLVLGIREQPGNRCHGYAFRLQETELRLSLRTLMARELVTDCYLPLWLPVELSDGREVPALTMAVNEHHRKFVQPTFEEKISLISTASGPRGANSEYLINIARHLEACGIHDEEIASLYQHLMSQSR